MSVATAIINVRDDFFARGEGGSSASTDRAAFVAAMAAANAATYGATIVVPPGQYELEDLTLTLDANVSLIGAGRLSTKIMRTGEPGDLINLAAEYGSVISDMSLNSTGNVVHITEDMKGAMFQNLRLTSGDTYWMIRCTDGKGQFGSTFINISNGNNNALRLANGLYLSGGHLKVITLDLAALGRALVMNGHGLHVEHFRIEVSNSGMELGYDRDGNNGTLSHSSLANGSTESCIAGLKARINSCEIRNVGITGFEGLAHGPGDVLQDPEVGINLDAAFNSRLAKVHSNIFCPNNPAFQTGTVTDNRFELCEGNNTAENDDWDTTVGALEAGRNIVELCNVPE